MPSKLKESIKWQLLWGHFWPIYWKKNTESREVYFEKFKTSWMPERFTHIRAKEEIQI